MLNREEGKRENFKRRRKEGRKNKGRSSVGRGRSTKHFTDFRKSKKQAHFSYSG
jgi:hypothetical protein